MRVRAVQVLAGVLLACCGCTAGSTRTVGGCPQPTAPPIGSTAKVRLFIAPGPRPTVVRLGAYIGQAHWFRLVPKAAGSRYVGSGRAVVVRSAPSRALRVTTPRGAVTLQWVGYGCA
jgi:hypothetical protein